MSNNLKRPKRGESEDDLLEFQEQFLKSMNQQPSVKIIRENTPVKTEQNETKMDLELDDQALTRILSDIVEKSTVNQLGSQLQIDSAVPKIEKINLTQLNTTGTKKKSLFAQNLENKGQLKAFYPLDKVSQPALLKTQIEKNIKTDVKSDKLKQIITGDGLGNTKDVEQIHLENLERLSQMNPNEILEEQRKLLQQLDPKIVSFLRKRKMNENSTTTTTNKEDKQPKQQLTDELLNELPIKPDKKWLHMDKIEYEKLEWMMKPKSALESSQSKSARFDFQGNVMTKNEEVAVTLALHHHGNEPDLAGYTLDELFHLARSKFNQQRVLALQTIGNILAKCHQGAYHDIVKSGTDKNEEQLDENDKHNLLNQLIDGGVLYLLRWSLDDQTESIINASLIGLKNILQPFDQENILDLTFDLYKGQEMPSLYPFSELVDDISGQKQLLYKLDQNLNLNERKEMDQLSDEEYIKCDLIKGLFRMNLIDRIFYLLNAYQANLSSNQIIYNIFMILFRCLRHSNEISYDFSEKHSTLLDLIVRNFMPKFISANELNNVPVLQNLTLTIKLFRLLCSSGANISFKLCQKYDLNTRLVNYLAIYESNMDSIELVKLQIESIRLLKVLTVYHGDYSQTSIDTLSNSFELILKHFNNLINQNTINIQYLQAMISMFNNLIINASEDDSNLKLKYEMCSSVYSLVQMFTFNQFKLLFSSNVVDLNLLSVCIHFIADYLEKVIHGSFFKFDSLSNLSSKSKVYETVIENLLVPIMTNQLKLDELVMSKLTANSTTSTDNSVADQLKRIKGNNLSYLPTILNDMTFANQIASFCFLASYFRLYSLCFKLNLKYFELNDFSATRCLLNNAYLKSYLKQFVRNENGVDSYLRIKYENLMVYHCLKLVFILVNFEDSDSKSLKEEEKRFFYLVSLNLLQKLKQGDEFYAHDVIASFIFNMNIWSTYLNSNEREANNFLVKHFEQMCIQDERIEFSFPHLNSNRSDTVKIDKTFISNLESTHIYENLNQIKLTYLESDYLLNAQLLEHSRKLNDLNKLNSLLKSKFYSNKSLFESDWIYAPVKYYLKKAQNKNEPQIRDETSTMKTISSISNSLKLVYLLEVYFNDYLDSNLELTVRYVHLLYIYLFESEVFLDKQIETYLYLIYFKLAIDKKCPLQHLKLNHAIPDMISFYDFYQCLLKQYDSTSFGDYLFSLYIIVPLQQNYAVKYRQLFWSDFSHLFKYIKFSSEATKLLIPIQNFVQPYEKSLSMIRLYSQILLDADDYRMISGSKFGYSILIAHLNSFIFEHSISLENKLEFDFKKLLVSTFLSLTNEKLKHDLIYFKSFNAVTFEQEFYAELPNIRMQWLNQLNA